jgi:hypothetical protein
LSSYSCTLSCETYEPLENIAEYRDVKDNKVNISRLKKWASQYLSSSSNLRSVLLLEKETLTKDEFLAKMGTWMILAKREEFSKLNRSVSNG